MTSKTSSEQDLNQSLNFTQALPASFFSHRIIFSLSAIALLGFSVGGVVINPLDMPVLAGLVILLLGVPHGALDVAIWSAKTRDKRFKAVSRMLLFYLSLASGFLCLWLVVPALALPAFIVLSIYHFSGDWERDLEFLPRLVVSAAIVTAPLGFNRAEVVEIFSWLSPGETATAVALVMAVAAVPLLQASAVIIAIIAVRQPWAAAELLAVLTLGWLTSPLLFFLVYFCGLHSVRHVIETRQLLGTPSARELALLAFPYALLAVIGTLAGAIMLSTLPIGPAVLGTIFMALGAFTVPHIWIVDSRRS
jgi:Brp/Blh family beta-carotene 15,15'-monooxygenase